MTISDQLQFSILSAPVASADRRVLSQAWYSALYRAGGKPAQSVAPRGIIKPPAAGAPRSCTRGVMTQRTCETAPRAAKNCRELSLRIGERRAPRAEL